MNDTERLADYRSENGEHIVITTGWKTRRGINYFRNNGKAFANFTRYTTEVYSDGQLIRSYDGGSPNHVDDSQRELRLQGELFEEQIPLILPLLNEASERLADSEELVSSLDSLIFSMGEAEAREGSDFILPK